jgi:hypothetical protein
VGAHHFALGAFDPRAHFHAFSEGFGLLVASARLQQVVVFADDEGAVALVFANAAFAQRAVVAVGAPFKSVADFAALFVF